MQNPGGRGVEADVASTRFREQHSFGLSNARIGSSLSARFLRHAPPRYILGVSLTTRFP
jgi:hypothetical protein